jgi:hypothetical protein
VSIECAVIGDRDQESGTSFEGCVEVIEFRGRVLVTIRVRAGIPSLKGVF